jgi:tetratricopeptide (TPR) repeat protein
MRKPFKGIIGFVLLLALASPVCAAHKPWNGRAVMTKRSDVAPRVGRHVIRAREGEVYTVERTQGDWLWVGEGWLLAHDVVAVDEAEAWFTAEIQARPSPFAYLSRAAARGEAGNHRGLILDCTAALRLDPRSQAAYHFRAAAYANTGEPARALADIQAAIRLGRAGADLYRDRGGVRWQLHDYQGALADLNYALSLDRSDPYAYDMRGATHMVLGNVDQALNDLNKSVELDPTNANALANRGWAYTLQKSYDLALADFKKALHINPRFARARVNRGDLWLHRGEIDKAIEEYDEALRIDAKYDGAWCQRAVAYRRKGDLDRAAGDIEEAIRLNAREARNFRERAMLHYERQEYGEMLKDATTATQLDPKNDFGFEYAACAKSFLGDNAGALADFGRAIQLSPKKGSRYLQRAELLCQTGDYGRALADCEAALRLSPYDSYLYGLRATVRQRQGDTEGAKADLQKAAQLAPQDSAMLQTMLAQAAEQANDHAQAIEIYRQVLANESASRLQQGLTYEALAKIWAECPDAQFRDGRRAVEAATKACELTFWKLPDALSALAAAHAECGDFAEALRWQTKAMELPADALATAFGDEAFVPPPRGYGDQLETRLNCFQQGKRLYEVVVPELSATPSGAAAVEHFNRATDRGINGDHAGALAEYDEAIRLEPQVAQFYASRANCRELSGDLSGAIVDHHKAIELAGVNAAGFWHRLGQALESQGRDLEALDAYAHALEGKQTPRGQAETHVALAKIWAESSDRSVRDGRRALEAANKACELTEWKSPVALTVLASAHAERGDFEQAVHWLEKAIETPPLEEDGPHF